MPQCMLGYTPPGADTPQEKTPLGANPPVSSNPPPRAVHAGRYVQQAGGTHPTGMHTCLLLQLHFHESKKLDSSFSKRDIAMGFS